MAHLEKCLPRFGHLALGNVLVCLQLLRPRIEYIGHKECIFLGLSKHFHLLVSVFQNYVLVRCIDFHQVHRQVFGPVVGILHLCHKLDSQEGDL